MSIYRGTGGANEATDLATNQAVIAKEFAEQAANAATQANLTLDAFQDIYLGPFSTNPTVDNDGNALQVGALYFSTSDQLLRVWNGTNWLVSAVSEPSSFTRNTFSGTGSQTVFTLSTTPVNNDSVFVFISGVLTSAYNVSGTTLTFTSAPASGTNNILAIVASTVSTLAPADNSVSTVKLQNNAVTTTKLADAAVTSTQLADNAVTTNKILNANVTLSKLAANSVDASKIVDGSVGASELANNAVTNSKIIDNAVTTNKITDSNVTSAKLASITTGATVGSGAQIPVITYNDKGQITNTSTVSLPTPTGVIFDFAGVTAPVGALALPLVPTNVSRTTYANLFAVIGTTWGAGDGSTTFGLPYFPENFASIQSNGNVGSQSTGQMPSHSHTVSVYGGAGGGAGLIAVATGSTLAGSANTNAAGTGSNNLAAGIRVLKCIWL